MNKLLPLIVILAATPALAESKRSMKEFSFSGGDSGFVEKYMQCDDMRAAAKNKAYDQFSCADLVNMKYCEHYAVLPKPIKQKINLELACDFLAGEYKGDDSEQDKAVVDAIRAMDCVENDHNSLKMLRENIGKEAETRALLFFTEEYLAAEGQCMKALDEEEKKKAAAKPEEKGDAAPEAKAEETPKQVINGKEKGEYP